jgi:hypothetical protein
MMLLKQRLLEKAIIKNWQVFLAQADKDGKGNNTVKSAIYTYLAWTFKAEKAANSNPDSAAEKPR